MDDLKSLAEDNKDMNDANIQVTSSHIRDVTGHEQLEVPIPQSV